MAKMNNILPPGTTIPYISNAQKGHWVEDCVEAAGITINRRQGVDVGILGVEIKSKCVESSSPNSIATMSINKIISTDYEDSLICEKLQHVYRVEYSNETQTVVSEEEFDFTDPSIQTLFRNTYEKCRKEIESNFQDGIVLPYISGEYGQFEITPTKNSYSFRIPVGKMKKIKAMSKSAPQFNKIFDVVEE